MCNKYFLLGLSLMLGMNPANGASNSKVLCERIANHCRAACATYWDECHMEEDFTNELTPAIMPMPAKRTTSRRTTTTTTRPFDETIYPVLRPEPFRPAVAAATENRPQLCAPYREPCGMGQLCCKGYSCRYQDVTTGIGYCF